MLSPSSILKLQSLVSKNVATFQSYGKFSNLMSFHLISREFKTRLKFSLNQFKLNLSFQIFNVYLLDLDVIYLT